MKIEDKKKPLYTFAVLFGLCFVGILYLWQHVSVVQMGYAIRQNEIKYENLIDEKERLVSLISKMESPANIESLLASLNSNLKQSKNPNVIRVKL